MPVVRPAELSWIRAARPAGSPTRCRRPWPASTPARTVRVVRVDPGPRLPHLHPHSAEVVYVLTGTGTTWEGDEAHPVGPGDVVVVPTGVPHATVATSRDAGSRSSASSPHPDLAANTEELPGPDRST